MDGATRLRNGMNLGALASDPASPVEGDFYRNSSTAVGKWDVITMIWDGTYYSASAAIGYP